MMQNILFFLKKISLYVVAMVFAMALAYKFGMAPLLKAQTPPASGAGTDLNDFPELRGGSPNDPTTGNSNGYVPDTSGLGAAPEQQSSGQESTGQVPSLPPDQQSQLPQQPPTEQPAANLPNQAPNQALPPTNSGSSSGLIFKYTQSYVGDTSSPDRDPFRKPYYILELEEQSRKPETPISTEVKGIDEKMEAIRRWPLTDYKLVGVIWDVKNPKAMIVDPANTMHLLKRNYRIGDRNGIITAISEGSITVIQNNVPVVIELATGSNNK